MFNKILRHPASAPVSAMCFDPGTAAFLLVASTALSATAAIQEGQAAAAQGKFQAGILRQRADRDRQVAAANEEDFRRKQSRLIGKRRAALGASGVEQGTGSPLLVAEDFAGEVELGALRIRSTGETSATRLEQQADLERFRGRSARRAGFIRGGALLFSGAGKAFGGGGTTLPAGSLSFGGPR